MSRITIFVKDLETDRVLENLGTIVTDSPNRAVQMHNSDLDKWIEKGYQAALFWEWAEESKAAAALGRKGGAATSEAKTEANRAKANNPPGPGKRPRGRPKKQAEE